MNLGRVSSSPSGADSWPRKSAVADIEPAPEFLHAGFKAAVPADVRTLLDRIEADGITIVERDDEAVCTGVQVPRPGRPPGRGALGAAFLPIMRKLIAAAVSLSIDRLQAAVYWQVPNLRITATSVSSSSRLI